MDLLQNPWIINLLSGIVLSILTYSITNYFSRKKKSREYYQKISAANNEILYLIKPIIIENKIIKHSVFESIKSSIAQKYNIKPEHLYSNLSISNDLIHEIMANSFLSVEQKMELCELIDKMFSNSSKQEEETKMRIKEFEQSLILKNNNLAFAMIAFIFSLVISMFLTSNTPKSELLSRHKISLLLLITSTPLLLLIVYSLLQERRVNKEKSIVSKNGNEKKE